MGSNSLRLVTANDASTVHRTYVTRIQILKTIDRVIGVDQRKQKAIQSVEIEEHTARAYIIGTTSRADFRLPGGLLPRHVMILTYPTDLGVEIRVCMLHPDKTCSIWNPSSTIVENHSPIGGFHALHKAYFQFDGYSVIVESKLSLDTGEPENPGIEAMDIGEQLAFYQYSPVQPVGSLLSSIAGPTGGGHAIPAIISDESEPVSGTLVIRSRFGSHRHHPLPSEIANGILVGRSRRCVIGRGFNENDGLSRLHAVILALPEGVFAFDLASRYGLRDVTQPSTLLRTVRIDDGSGCLVYGAGHLLYEF